MEGEGDSTQSQFRKRLGFQSPIREMGNIVGEIAVRRGPGKAQKLRVGGGFHPRGGLTLRPPCLLRHSAMFVQLSSGSFAPAIKQENRK